MILDARKNTQSFIRKSKSGGKVSGVQACGAKSGGGGKISGHIPGSALAPWKEYAITKKGQLHDQVPTKAQFEELMQKSSVNQGSAIVVAYRGEGPKEVGFATRPASPGLPCPSYWGNKQARLYDGSMEEWAKDSSRPVSTFTME